MLARGETKIGYLSNDFMPFVLQKNVVHESDQDFFPIFWLPFIPEKSIVLTFVITFLKELG